VGKQISEVLAHKAQPWPLTVNPQHLSHAGHSDDFGIPKAGRRTPTMHHLPRSVGLIQLIIDHIGGDKQLFQIFDLEGIGLGDPPVGYGQ
jgi:hypothetical protein